MDWGTFSNENNFFANGPIFKIHNSAYLPNGPLVNYKETFFQIMFKYNMN